MNPVESNGTIRYVPLEMIGSRVEAIESGDPNPTPPRVATPPVVYRPLVPRAAYYDSTNSLEYFV
jgi:hypothetical protein